MTTTIDEGRCTCAIGQPCTCGTYDETANRTYLSSPPVAVPCPDWCSERPGHGYDSLTGDGEYHQVRIHSHQFGDLHSAAADVVAHGVFRDRSEAVDRPHIVVWVDGDSCDRDISDPEQARQLAAHLTVAADLLESLQQVARS